MKIYDCFMFFNELDLLEIRFEELNPYVDYFVLVESRQTHSREPKRLYFEENKNRFKKWDDKIIHIVMDMPRFTLFDKLLIKWQLRKPNKFLSNLALSHGFGRWKMEWAQRSAIGMGLRNAKGEDIILISDIDEIPDHHKLKEAISFAKSGGLVGFIQQTYMYYLNGKGETKGIGTKMCSYKSLKEKCNGDPQKLRIPSFFTRTKNKIFGKAGYHGNVWNADLEVIRNGGWHFTFLGGAEAVKTKIKNYPHVENFSIKKDAKESKIRKDIEQGKLRDLKINYIPLDSSFPETILKRQKKYAHLIRKI